MPTSRPRHQVTETPEVARVLDLAARRWPDLSRSKLLLRLVDVGAAALERGNASETAAHRAAVLSSSGRYDDAFNADFLAESRSDWPA